MTGGREVTVTGPAHWSTHVDQLAQILASSHAATICDPSGQRPTGDDIMQITRPEEWAADRPALRDALRFVAGTSSSAAQGSRVTSGVAAPVEQRLVYTVEEAATLLGISRSFAYEAVQRGDIPSMRIGRRILVPKAALERFLASVADDPTKPTTSDDSS